MGVRPFGFAAAIALAAAALTVPSPAPSIPAASAACPAAEVVFARGREEPPGVGYIGSAFVNALQSRVQVPVGSYGVDYPADVDPGKGAADMSKHVQSMAKHCPNTREVLGGYSLGAISTDLVVSLTNPAFGFNNPLPPSMDQHVAAVALFGNGTRRVLGPVPEFSPAFAGKTIDQCAPGDPICSSGLNFQAHLQQSYFSSGLIEQAAAFTASRL